MEHPNAVLIRRLYQARADNDRKTVREIVAPDVAWFDPYPPPHGGALRGLEVVYRLIFEQASELPKGSTRLWLEDVLAKDDLAVALVNWSMTLRGRAVQGREVGVYRIRDGKVVEARFYIDDPAYFRFFPPEGG
jgi:ketosteroid isomerase-like protein